MKYNIGDQVRLRKDLIVGMFYGNYEVNNDIKFFRGTLVTIKSVEDNYYTIKEIDALITDEMLESDLTFPLLMEVSDDEDFEISYNLIVLSEIPFGKPDYKYICVEEGYEDEFNNGERYNTEKFRYARKIEPIKMTLKEICKKLGKQIILVDE